MIDEKEFNAFMMDIACMDTKEQFERDMTLKQLLAVVSEAVVGLNVISMSLTGAPLERAKFHQARLERMKEKLNTLLVGNS